MHHGVDGKAGYRLDAKLLGDVLPVGDDGGQTDVQFVGNLFVDAAPGNEREHLNLAR